MNSDPDVYPEPEVFRPERFLDKTGTHEVIPANTHGDVRGRSIHAQISRRLTPLCRDIWPLDTDAEPALEILSATTHSSSISRLFSGHSTSRKAKMRPGKL